MNHQTKTHNLNNFDSNFERRFQEETTRIQKNDAGLLSRSENGDHNFGVLDGIRHKGAMLALVGALAAGATGLSMGKNTIGERIGNIFPDDSPPVTNPLQLEQQAKANHGQLPTDQQ